MLYDLFLRNKSLKGGYLVALLVIVKTVCTYLGIPCADETRLMEIAAALYTVIGGAHKGWRWLCARKKQ